MRVRSSRDRFLRATLYDFAWEILPSLVQNPDRPLGRALEGFLGTNSIFLWIFAWAHEQLTRTPDKHVDFCVGRCAVGFHTESCGGGMVEPSSQNRTLSIYHGHP